jgi:pimeloyl-ACP methyl ester carboxylesterase
MSRSVALLVAALAGPLWSESCERLRSATPEPLRKAARQMAAAAGSGDPALRGPIRMELLKGDGPEMFVMRGGPRGPERLVFLHGMCGHGLGYAQSFQFSAAKYGTLIAPQADRRCGQGPWAKWSGDLDALDGRIQAAFRALGHAEPIEDIVIMGYSQGATRAEALARKWPRRYTRLVLMGAPSAIRVRGLTPRAVVTMAGERDRQDLMKTGARALAAAKIPAVFKVIPGATHGAMGPTPEATMGDALAWLFEHSLPKVPAPGASAAPAASAAPGASNAPAVSAAPPTSGAPLLGRVAD